MNVSLPLLPELSLYNQNDILFTVRPINLFPDVIFGNYGQTVMLGEVEVDSTINSESIERWKLIQNLGISLIIFVPKVKLKIVRDMCWENKLIEKVKVSFFSVEIPLK